MRSTLLRPLALLLGLVIAGSLVTACATSRGPASLSGPVWFVTYDANAVALVKTTYQFDGTAVTTKNTATVTISGFSGTPSDMLMVGGTLLVASSGGLFQVDPATGAATQVTLPAIPTHLILGPGGDKIWATVLGGGSLLELPVGRLNQAIVHAVGGADSSIGVLAFGAGGQAYYCTVNDSGCGTVDMKTGTTTHRLDWRAPFDGMVYDSYTPALVGFAPNWVTHLNPTSLTEGYPASPVESVNQTVTMVKPDGLGHAFVSRYNILFLVDVRNVTRSVDLSVFRVADVGTSRIGAIQVFPPDAGGGTEVAAPKASIDSSLQGLITNNPTPALTGTVYPWFSTVTLTLDGKSTTVKADSMGRWSYTPPSPLSDGQHTLTASATNSGGASPTVTATFTVDTIPPAVTTARADGSFSNQAAAALTGTAEAGSTVKVTLDGQVVSTQTATKDGTWSYTPAAPLLDGRHTLQVGATDAAGNAAQASANFTVDTVPPTIALTAPSDGARSRDGKPLLAGTAEPGSTVSVYADGKAIGTTTADTRGDWSFAPAQALSDGAHSLRAVAADAAGNTAGSATVNVTVKSSAPQAAIDEPNLAAFALSGSSEPGASVTVVLDGEARGTVSAGNDGSWSVPITAITTGPHSVRITALDAYGNTARASRDFAVPEIVLLQSPGWDVFVEDRTPLIAGRAEPGATVSVTLDGAAVSVSADRAGTFRYTPASPLAYGEHHVTASIQRADGTTFTTPAVRFTVVDWR